MAHSRQGMDRMSLPPFEWTAAEKMPRLLEQLNGLTCLHASRCPLYGRYLQAWGVVPGTATSLAELPYLPARAFKLLQLKSVPDGDIVKTIQSSGTSGATSRVYVDGRTSIRQSRALLEIIRNVIGDKRPMLVLDSPAAGRNSAAFSARSAGALGFSQCASETVFALDERGQLDLNIVEGFLKRMGDTEFMVFGFTFLVWQVLVQEPLPTRLQGAFRKACLFHGGGWKKLASLGISDQAFRTALAQHTGLQRIHNYYGMAEQTGSIFVECEYGRMHASKYSEILIRDPVDLHPCQPGDKGVIQVLSSLPESYPGHSILTEDVGWVEPDGLCACGRNGTCIHVEGRLQRAEARGCSDVY